MIVDNLTLLTKKKAYFPFVMNLITRIKEKYRHGRGLKIVVTNNCDSHFFITLELCKTYHN